MTETYTHYLWHLLFDRASQCHSAAIERCLASYGTDALPMPRLLEFQRLFPRQFTGWLNSTLPTKMDVPRHINTLATWVVSNGPAN